MRKGERTRMFVTITSSQVSAEQSEKIEAFLATFLPRVKQLPGVVAIYHYTRPDKGDDSTIIVWESRAALQAYRDGDLIQEAIAFEKQHDLTTTREGYPVTYGTNCAD
jgi:heme-degrading monooxygenase HmoA